jgi:F-type H+-transporting ATPase subunit epsilon
MAMSFHLDIVSLEGELFSGLVEKLFAKGEMGEFEILYGHTPFLTHLRPGPVWLVKQNGQQEMFYISAGFLEVQPAATTILAETGTRAQDIDEAKSLEAKKRAEDALVNRGTNFNYAQALFQLAEAGAQLHVVKKWRKEK